MSIDIGDLKNSLDKYRQNVKLSMKNSSSHSKNEDNLNDNNSVKITVKKPQLIKDISESAMVNNDTVINNETVNNKNKLSLDVKIMQKRLQKYTDQKNYKNIKSTEQSKTIVEKETVDILRASDIFNVVNDEKPYLTWRKLDIETQKKLIYDFCNKLSPPINQDALDKLIELINIKKLYIKREIEYDSINGRIEALPIIRYDTTLQKYLVIKTEVVKKYNAKKSARQFMTK